MSITVYRLPTKENKLLFSVDIYVYTLYIEMAAFIYTVDIDKDI